MVATEKDEHVHQVRPRPPPPRLLVTCVAHEHERGSHGRAILGCDMQVITSAVKSKFLFKQCGDEKLRELVLMMAKIEVTKGQTVIKQGDKGDFFYVAERGKRLEALTPKVRSTCPAGMLICSFEPLT